MDIKKGIFSNNIPIIFLHIGDIFYLKYTLRSAVYHNQKGNIILIGNDSNKKYERLGIKHFNFDDYLDSSDINEFEVNYKLIGGSRFLEINAAKGYDWTKYNFLKWFVLRNFLNKHDIENCWTFDSDNMILCDLQEKSYFFEHLDCTVRPSFSMIMGKINNPMILQDYCTTIIQLFKDQEFLENQRIEFNSNAQFGFTMMRAFMKFYELYQNKYKIDTFEKINKGELFLDMLLRKGKNIFVINEKKEKDSDIKQLYQRGSILFVKHVSTGDFIKLNSIDLSWVPEYYFSKILSITTTGVDGSAEKAKRIDFSIPVSYWVRNKSYLLRKAIRKIILKIKY